MLSVPDDTVVLVVDKEEEQIDIFFPGEEPPEKDEKYPRIDVLLESEQSNFLLPIISACKEAEDETLKTFRDIISHIASASYQEGTGKYKSL
jgi:hypothetical protein